MDRTIRATRERLHTMLGAMAHPGLARAIESKAEARIAEGKLGPRDVEQFVKEQKRELAPMAELYPAKPGDCFTPQVLREYRGGATRVAAERQAFEEERSPAKDGTPRQKEVRTLVGLLAASLAERGHAHYAETVRRAVEKKIDTDPDFTAEDVPAFVARLTSVPQFVKDHFADDDADEEEEPGDGEYAPLEDRFGDDE
jgi:hypothetical protein